MPDLQTPTSPAASQWVSKLTTDIAAYQAQIQTIILQQEAALNAKDEDTYVRLYLQYNEISREINDRQHLLEVLGAGEERFANDLYKAEFWSYLVAAETVDLNLVNELTEKMHATAPAGFAEAESYDEIQAAYKNYILPGKIIGGRFDELDGLVDEMNTHIQRRIPTFDRSLSLPVLPYAFSLTIDSDTENEAVKQALETREFAWIQPEERNRLLKEMAEQIAYVQDELVRNEQIARNRYRDFLQQKEGAAQPPPVA